MAIHIRKLPKDPGPAAWNAILPQRGSSEPLGQELNADWLVIGAGFAGLAAARRLSQLHATDSIVVMEACNVADGPAGRNSGFMIDLPHDLSSEDYGGALAEDHKQTAMNRAAISFAFDAAKEYGMSDEAITVSGKINAAATAKGMRLNQSYATHLTAMGEPYELVSAKQMREITGIDYYNGGLYTPGTAVLQPAMYIRGFAQGLVSNGVSIFENSPVIRLDRDGDNWRADSNGGAVSAPRVLLAVNGHAESFGFYKRKLMHVFTYASMTRPLTASELASLGGLARWGLTPADPLGTTVRRISGTGGTRLIIRNRFTYDPSMEVSEKRLGKVAKIHDRSFKERFSMLAGIEMEYRWGGRLCLSRNHVQAVAEVRAGVFTAVCQNGLGAARGTLGGMMAAELASGFQSELLQQFTDQKLPAGIPPEPIAWLGVNAALRWGEFKAGKEL